MRPAFSVKMGPYTGGVWRIAHDSLALFGAGVAIGVVVAIALFALASAFPGLTETRPIIGLAGLSLGVAGGLGVGAVNFIREYSNLRTVTRVRALLGEEAVCLTWPVGLVRSADGRRQMRFVITPDGRKWLYYEHLEENGRIVVESSLIRLSS